MSSLAEEAQTVQQPLAASENRSDDEPQDLDFSGVIDRSSTSTSSLVYSRNEFWHSFNIHFARLWHRVPPSWSAERDPKLALHHILTLLAFLSLCVFVFAMPSILRVISPTAPTPPGTAPNLDEAASLITGQRGAVAADHPICSELGVKVMRDMHGNAVDAMVSTLLCQGVLAPFASGLGGGAFILIHHTKSATSKFYDAREAAPKAANPDIFRKSSPRVNGASVAVPGELRGLHMAHKEWGSLKWQHVVTPVIEIAENAEVGQFLGIKLIQMNETIFSSPSLRKLFTKRVPTKESNAKANAEASVELPGVRISVNVSRGVIETLQDGSLVDDASNGDKHGVITSEPNATVHGKFTDALLQVGDKLHNSALIKTLKQVAEKGPDAFYIDLSTTLAKEIEDAGGVMTDEDIKGYKVKVREVIESSYQGFTVIGAPLPSTGGVTIGLALNMIHRLRFRKIGRNGLSFQYLAETLKWIFGARMGLGDPDFIPGSEWRSKRLLSRREALKRVYQIRRRRTFLPYHYSKRISTSKLEGGTSHVSILDQNGTAVSVTSSINLPFGSGLLSQSSGVILNDQMDAFTTSMTRTNAYGLYPSAENIVQGGKRPLSSMCPTIVLFLGKVYMIVGGSGGPQATSGVLQTLLNVIDFGDRLSDSINAPRIHHQLVPNEVSIENANSTTCEETHSLTRTGKKGANKQGWPYWKSVCTSLKEAGHKVVGPAVHGAVQAVLAPDALGRGKGLIYASSDPRRIGKAAAY